MSHTTCVKLEFKDIDVAKSVCEGNGWRFLGAGQVSLHGGSFHADHRIQIDEKVMGGLIRQKDGSYELRYDTWQTSVSSAEFDERFLQKYSEEVNMKVGLMKGFSLKNRTKTKSGDIKLRLKRW